MSDRDRPVAPTPPPDVYAHDPNHRHGWDGGRAIFRTPDSIHRPLHVIVPITNQLRFKARWKHAQRFFKHVNESGATLTIVEAAFGERDHALEQQALEELAGAKSCNADQPHQYIRLRMDNTRQQELWHKEALINLGIARLPHDWRYVAWIDADVMFLRPNWVGEVVHALQHYDFLQPFTQAQDLDPGYTAMGTKPSFVHAWMEGIEPPVGASYYYGYGYGKRHGAWSGLAWACTRQAFDAVGGLLDGCITGAADWYMAWALIGRVEGVIPKGSHPGFVRHIMEWQERAEKHIRHNIGTISGTVAHMWHGRKKDRRYIDRSRLLATLQFDPSRDLKRDWQGMWQLVDHGDARSLALRDEIRRWFRQRNEDSVDVD
jgi:hypothetical protein